MDTNKQGQVKRMEIAKENTLLANVNIKSEDIVKARDLRLNTLIGGVIGGLFGDKKLLKKYNDIQMDMLSKLKKGASLESIHKELSELAYLAGSRYGIGFSKYEGVYVINDQELRDKILKKGNKKENELDYLYLDDFDPKGMTNIKNNQLYKEAAKEIIEKGKKEYEKNKGFKGFYK